MIGMTITSATSTQTPQKFLIQVLDKGLEQSIGGVMSSTTPFKERMNLALTMMTAKKLYKTLETLLKKSKT